jgi:hypothetical protein
MKPCIYCRQVKPLSEFYVHSAMRDGHLNVCKPCKRAYARRYSKTDAGKINAIKRQRTDRRHRWQNEYRKKRLGMSPEKYRARNVMSAALRDGKIHKEPICEFPGCSCSVVQGHHEDYSRPLDVRWLCFKHHRQRDIELGLYPHIKKVL